MTKIENDKYIADPKFLYYQQGDGFSIEVTAFFCGDELRTDGFDYGAAVEYVHGDWDFEYWMTLPPASVDQLFSVLGVTKHDRRELLAELTKHAHGKNCYQKCRQFFDDNNIEYSSMFWS